ncbi:MAG: hypothetical protein ACLSHC_10930 [Bilophila wadsworthia]
MVINQLGSLLAPFFTPTAVTTFTDAKGSDVAKYARYFQGLSGAWPWPPPSSRPCSSPGSPGGLDATRPRDLFQTL